MSSKTESLPEENVPSQRKPKPRASARLTRLVSAFFGSWRGDVALITVLVIGNLLLHLGIPGLVPSGGDGGNWLALANEVRGLDVMSADVSYPPLFPALLALRLQLNTPPIVALLLMALVAKTSLVVAVYINVRTLSRTYAMVAATLVATAAAQMEAYAWGGYPQLLGMAFGLLAVFLILRYLNTQERSHLWIGLIFVAATLATHVLIGSLLGVVIGIAVLHWLYIVDPRRRDWVRGLKVGAVVAGSTALGGLALFFLVRGTGTEATLNPHALSRWEGLSHVFRDAPLPWAVIGVAAVVVLFFRYWPEHIAATLAVGSAWAVTSAAFFLITGEQRGLLILQVGLILLATLGFGAARMFVAGPEKRRYSVGEPRTVRHRLLLVASISMFFAIVVAGLGAYAGAVDWYRVVDRAEIAALDHLNQEAQFADVVVAARGHNGNPAGWWVEGYAELPTWTGVDVRFLAFPDEREQAEIVNSIFGGGLSDDETIVMLREIGVDYLVVDRRGPDAVWLDSGLARSLPVLDDTSNLVILEVPPPG